LEKVLNINFFWYLNNKKNYKLKLDGTGPFNVYRDSDFAGDIENRKKVLLISLFYIKIHLYVGAQRNNQVLSQELPKPNISVRQSV
jgi:hypothetical protein